MEMFHTHIAQDNVRHNLNTTLQMGRLSEGSLVKCFEGELVKQLGLVNPVAVNSGTSALYLALRLAGVGPGDRVILSAVTFIATAAAILQCGAAPVFADVDPYTGNIDPESVKEILGKVDNRWRVKAIIAVHWLGLPCDMEPLSNIVYDVNEDVCLIGDAAHALGAVYDGVNISDWYFDYSCFSFQATKHLTTGDGGAVCPLNYDDSFRAKKLRWFGINREEPIGLLGEREFELDEVGGKYHMNDVAAAIGLGNLDGFADRLDIRRRHNDHYRDELETMIGLRLLDSPTDRESACYAFGLRVQRRADFARAMKERNVPCSVIASRIDKYGFNTVRRSLPGTDIFDTEFIALPCHEALTDDDIDTIIKAVRDGW